MFWRKRTTRDFNDEIESHIQLEIERLRAEGLSEEAAQAAAYRKFGSPRRARETFYESRRWMWWDHLAQDVRYGLRTLRKSPGFTAVAILTLALGIGANTAIFSVVYAVLFHPLPYYNASRLVDVRADESFTIGDPLSAALFRSVRDQRQLFDAVATYRYERFILTGESAPEYLAGTEVGGDFFSLLGVPPLMGRPVLPQDSAAASDPVAVLSYSIWNDIFGGDSKIIGHEITLNHERYTVIGIMPPHFEFPSDDMTGMPHGLWVGLRPWLKQKPEGEPPLDVIARLKKGVTLADANAQLHTLATQLIAGRSEGSEHLTDLRAFGVSERIGGRDRPALLILLAAVAFVLLIACVNVSGLLLARGWSRRGEIAIRAALGATRYRVIRQLLTENILLSLAGGALGLLLSLWAMHVIRSIAPPTTPRVDLISLNGNVLWFTVGVSILAGLLSGMSPAWHTSAHWMGNALKENRPGSIAGSSHRRPRKLHNALVTVEVAFAVVLAVGAALTARSLEKLSTVKLGFRTDRILTMRLNFSESACPRSGAGSPDRCIAAANEVIQRVQAMSGVEDAAVAERPPAASGIQLTALHVYGQPMAQGKGLRADFFTISSDYFRLMGIRLLQGRGFRASDRKGGQPVAIVNDSFARQYLSGNPLGQRVSFYEDKNKHPVWLEIVGEVADTRDSYLYFDPYCSLYVPFAQEDDFIGATLIVRTAADPMAIMPDIRQRVWSADKDAPVTEVRTMQQVISDLESSPRFQTILLSSFGTLGLLLATIGTYGVISYAVAQRTHEIGVRRTLGATPRNILRLVIGDGLWLAAAGVATGVAASLALTRFMRGFLFEIKPTDPLAFAGVAILLLMAATLACYIPARRATRVDPMVALRHE